MRYATVTAETTYSFGAGGTGQLPEGRYPISECDPQRGLPAVEVGEEEAVVVLLDLDDPNVTVDADLPFLAGHDVSDRYTYADALADGPEAVARYNAAIGHDPFVTVETEKSR